MAQSTEKNYAGTPEDQGRRASGRERDEAKRMVDDMDAKKKSSTFAALDSIKKRYFNRLLGDKGIKVKSPKVSSVEETSLGKITTIPKIVQRNMNEIEIQPILKNFSYVRILYDTMANEYFYEAIEPKLIEEESELLDVLKEILVENLEMLDDADRARKENYLRRIVDGLLRELGVELQLQVFRRLEVGVAVLAHREPGREGGREVDLVPVVSGGAGARLELTFTRAKHPFEFLVVDHHDHALRACDSALPGCGDVLAIKIGEVFDSRHALDSPDSWIEAFEPELDNVFRAAEVDKPYALGLKCESASG